MPATIVQQRVRDFSIWKKEFDAIKDLRSESGAYGDQVYQDENDPNKVTYILRWKSLVNAKRYFSSAEEKAAMSRAGVEGLSSVDYVNEA